MAVFKHSIFGLFGKGTKLSRELDKFFKSKPDELKQLDMLNPRQQSLLRQLMRQIQGGDTGINEDLYQGGSDYLQDMLGGTSEDYQRFEAPYLRQFREQTIPQLAEQFGGIGAQGSSAFQQALGSSAADLQERLASLKAGLRSQAAGQAYNYAQLPAEYRLRQQQTALGTQPFGYQNIQGRPSYASQAIAPAVKGATAYFTGGAA